MNMNRLFTCLCLSLLFNLAQAQLPIPEYQKGKAILSGTIANYHPNDNLIFKIGAPNIVMGTAQPKLFIRLLSQTEALLLIFLSTIIHKYG